MLSDPRDRAGTKCLSLVNCLAVAKRFPKQKLQGGSASLGKVPFSSSCTEHGCGPVARSGCDNSVLAGWWLPNKS